MKVITEDTIGLAWLKTMECVINENAIIDDDKGAILEALSVVIEITNPTVNDRILDLYGSKTEIDFLKNNFEDLQPVFPWGYSYAQRLYDHYGRNQIETVIEILKANRLSKSATISLLDCQAESSHTPCLVSLDFKVRNNTVLVTAFFRSQDIGKKMYGDALEVLNIGQSVATLLNLDKVALVHFVSSAHIYREDFPVVSEILTKEGMKSSFFS